METQHVPVMLEEVLKYLQPEPGGHYIDGTLGGGGHTEVILERSAPDGKVLGIDTDLQALARVRERLAEAVSSGRLVLAHGNFAELARIVDEAGFVSIQGILLDVGFSSHQMDSAERGFSFSVDGPLDMRLDQSQGMSAADLVNSASEKELADLLWRYGEEKRSRQIARRIVRERSKGAITRTAQLAQLAELDALEAVLPQMLDVLSAKGNEEKDGKRGGRMVVISFHSLEDRIVKEFMRLEARDCICPPQVPVCVCDHKARLRLLTAKPVIPTAQEVIANPRARSAKLRAAEIVVGS